MAIKRYAEIEAGMVKNCSTWEEGTAPAGFIDVTDIPAAQKNSTHNGGNSFTRKAPPKVGRISMSATEITLGQSITVTIRAENSKYDNTLRTGFNETRNISVLNGEGVLVRPKFIFTNGVASKSVAPAAVGTYRIQQLSNESEVRLTGDMQLDVLTP